MSRTIEPRERRDADPDLIGFVRANGLDENQVVSAPMTVDDDAGTLTVTEFVVGDDGVPIRWPEHGAFEKRARTVPLLSPPSAHNL